jgi:hypothetical protein
VDDNGLIDHKSVEDNLNHNFEQDFNRYYESFFRALKKEDYEMLTGKWFPFSTVCKYSFLN